MSTTITARVQRLLRQTERMRRQAVRNLLRSLKHIDQERKQRTADLEEAAKVILNQLAEMGHIAVGKSTKAKKTTTKEAAKEKKRIRRSPEQLKAEAMKVLTMIKKAGKEGIGGGEIRKSFPGVGQDIKGLLAKNAGVKVKTTGEKSKMRYFSA